MNARLTVAGLDVTTVGVRAWVADLEGELIAERAVDLPVLRSAPDRVELDPAAWEAACRSALTQVVADLPSDELLGVTVSTPRGGFLLLDAGGEPLGHGVLEADRRGAAHLSGLAGTESLTGRPVAAGSTLAQLLSVRAEEPDRWAATARVLFLHDWLLWRMAGVQVTETSYACGGGLADVAARTWARDLLAAYGLGAGLLAPLVEAGTLVGELGEGWGLPRWLPVVAGCGDVQLAATGVGGLADGVLTVGAGGGSRVQLASAAPVGGPGVRVSTHAARGLWLLEGEVDSAEQHAVLGEVARLERALGRPADAVVVCGSLERAQSLSDAQSLSEALGRDVHVTTGAGAVPAAGAALVGRAVGAHVHLPALPKTLLRSASGR